MNPELTGRGLVHPLSLGGSGLADSIGDDRVAQSIRLILGTTPGERLMRPDFGCRLRSLAFMPNTPATADLARFFVTESLTRWEPRIELLHVDVSGEHGPGAGGGSVLLIDVEYRLRATGQVQTLTYPFSLERAR